VPLQLASTSDGGKDTVTQYAMGAVESLGLLKMDFLGLKNLTIIQKAIDLIKQRQNIEINLDSIPLDDTRHILCCRKEKQSVFSNWSHRV
jgi:DNA polymerase III subunit alpha